MRSGTLAALAALVACGKTTDPRVAPTIAAVSPDHGPAIGGSTLTITGTGLTDTSDMPIVLVGDQTAAVQMATDTQLAVTLPAGPEQTTVDVTISDAHGFAIAGSAFTYNPIPIVLAITPSGGPATGGTPITLTGRGFSSFEAGAPTIVIGGGVATSVQVVDDTTITAVTGPTVAGTPAFTPVDVQFANANGSGTLAAAFSTTKQGLLVIGRDDSSLTFFDPITKDSTQIGVLSTRLHACALGPDGKLYSVGRNPQTGAMSLFTFDPLSGSATVLGDLRDGGGTIRPVSSLAFAGSALYGYADGPCCNGPERLIAINTGSGSATLVGSAQVTNATIRGQGIAARDSGHVFYAETTNGTLDTLDLATSARLTGPPMTGGNGGRVHAMLTLGGNLYVIETGGPSTLYTADTVTGALTTLSSVANNAIAVCQTPPYF